ncbi:site-specific integrase [Maribacter sp. PR1]|uniref:Site-specific integrase n=1 Tax=Maribacter cobaltidurans TaxID=1178778 RepID=A0ABU7IWG3_9FLAO|nr:MULTISPECIES: site-specific integrase [Maribacter]MCR9264348.1 site-specific integrase [Flavobacteriaceae bacterium]MDC6389924.1 site-specific integrase [Maribacter sp. PR1]MEE1977314.1 site-specific integrase [Maribacter cobaltidurans]|tara:strand:+ start:399 stop:1649 length:1251 start_codon:yes stop_codon:yes gene_type:complete
MKSKHTFTVIFFTRKSRSVPNQLSIYVRITVDGQRSEISLKRNIPSKEWDSSRNRGRGGSQRIRTLNAYLDSVYRGLLDCHKELLEENRVVSSDAIKSRYLGEDDNSKTLRDLIKYHNGNMSIVLKKGTMKNYYTTEKYLYRFLAKNRKVNDVRLKQLNYAFVTDFEHFLRNYRDSKKRLLLGNNGVMKHLERFKKMLNLAVKLEWMDKNPFNQFQLKYNKYDRQFLDEEELEQLESTEMGNERLERIRDCFVFSCYTGLSYVDVKELNSDNIVKGIDGNHWISTKREKTDKPVKVPLLPKAREILEKYMQCPEMENKESLLPISSNQKTNAYLKEIADSCDIDKNLTFHVARHTFATTVMLSNGVPIETVSKLLGHSKLSTTQIYARVVESKISEDIGNLLIRFKEKTTKKSAAT